MGAEQPRYKAGTQLRTGRKPPCPGLCFPYLLGCPRARALEQCRVILSGKLRASQDVNPRRFLPPGWSSEGNSFQSSETMAN